MQTNSCPAHGRALSTAAFATLLLIDRTLIAMPVILAGLALALDVFGAASGLGVAAQWRQIGAGVAFALTAAATFGMALVLTQHEAGALDGRIRTAATMSIVAVLALAASTLQGGLHMPNSPVGWLGLAGLTLLYGTAITILFTVLPRLGVVGNSAIMNVEPIFALVLAWAVLGQPDDRFRAGRQRPRRRRHGHLVGSRTLIRIFSSRRKKFESAMRFPRRSPLLDWLRRTQRPCCLDDRSAVAQLVLRR